MNRFTAQLKTSLFSLYARQHLAWLVLTLALGALSLLSRRVEPSSGLVFRQLIALYLIDSILFFNIAHSHAKIGLLTLIFLATMEIFVTIFYLLAIYNGVTY